MKSSSQKTSKTQSQTFSRRAFIKTMNASFAAVSTTAVLPSIAKADDTNTPSNIKFSMYLYTLINAPLKKEELNIAEICQRTSELGIDGFDFIGEGYNKPWKQIRKIVDDHGQKTICYTNGVQLLESPEKEIRLRGIEAFKKRLEIAHILGTSRIMLNQGGSFTGNDSKTNRQWIIESLSDVLPLAKAANIEVTIETHNGKNAPFRTSSDFSEALKVAPDLRVCFDSGNSFINGEDPLTGYKNNKEHITHVHFKDIGKGSLGKARGLCVPGTGLVDMKGIVESMKESGYNGYINLEKGGPDGFEVYKESMKVLKPHLS